MPYSDPKKRSLRNKEWRKEKQSYLLGRREEVKSEKRSYISIIKSNPCSDCGLNFIRDAMTFDHRPEEIKSYDVYRLINHPTASLEKLVSEIEKCDLVCVGCHRDRSRNRLQDYVDSCKLHRPHRQSGCKKCTHCVSIRNLRIKRLHYIQQYKSKPCVDCNRSYPPWKMDFDHIHSKEDGVSNLVGSQASFERIKSEIAKCEVVCCWCHVIRTVSRRGFNG